MNEYQEAIEWIKRHENLSDNTEHDEVMNTAIHALEKQVPMKPIGIYNDKGGYAECPHCHAEECRGFDDDEFGYGGGYMKHNVCVECGGVLDWGEKNK